MVVLGIECSHDDISLAVLEGSQVVYLDTLTQTKLHSHFGGTVPELASREHVLAAAVALERLKGSYDLSKIDYVAYTKEPGLIGSLQICYLFASAIALALSRPLIPVNHLHGHFFSAAIEGELRYPVLGLIVSGGHTQIVYATSPDHIEVVGETSDDALGEVYDKVGRELGLDYPGGQEVDRLARLGQPQAKYSFSVPTNLKDLSLSFSGFKTQALRMISKGGVDTPDLCASFQEAVVGYLITSFKRAVTTYKPNSISLTGGVSANSLLRERFLNLHKHTLIPRLIYTTDNGAMIAKAAEIRLKSG